MFTRCYSGCATYPTKLIKIKFEFGLSSGWVQVEQPWLDGGSVIPAAVKTPDNKFARIIKPGRNMPAVKTPDKKFAQYIVSEVYRALNYFLQDGL